MMQQLKTPHFGVIEYHDSEIIYFPEGLPGFENTRNYILIGYGAEDAIFFWLQCLDIPELCFIVTDPFVVYNNYCVDIDDEDVKFLQITDSNKVLTLAIVVIPEDIKQTRVNLKAPITINLEKMIAKQIIQKDENAPLKYYLYMNT